MMKSSKNGRMEKMDKLIYLGMKSVAQHKGILGMTLLYIGTIMFMLVTFMSENMFGSQTGSFYHLLLLISSGLLGVIVLRVGFVSFLEKTKKYIPFLLLLLPLHGILLMIYFLIFSIL